jgi:hypothetical protein
MSGFEKIDKSTNLRPSSMDDQNSGRLGPKGTTMNGDSDNNSDNHFNPARLLATAALIEAGHKELFLERFTSLLRDESHDDAFADVLLSLRNGDARSILDALQVVSCSALTHAYIN